MKLLLTKSIFLGILFTSNVFFAQNKLSVMFKVDHLNDSDFLINELVILKDNQIFKKVEHPTSFPFYDFVNAGKYSFQYLNIFGENIVKEIFVEENKDYLKDLKLELYVDQLQDSIPKDLFLQKIKNDEKIIIKFKFSGCFNSGKDSLIVSKNKNNLYVLYKKKKRKIKPEEMKYFFQYENELKHLKKTDFVSTLNGFNEMIYNSEKLFYVEPSVYWNGYAVLKKRLKLK